MNELETQPRPVPVSGKTDGIFDTVDEAITATAAAQKIWARTSREIRGKVIEALRRAMHERGGVLPIVAKIEKPQAVDRLCQILAAVDGVDDLR